jgi:hypothetical protein
VILQPCGNGSDLAPSFWYASVELWRKLTDIKAVDPSIFPELAGLSVAWDQVCGGKKQGMLIFREFEVEALPCP